MEENSEHPENHVSEIDGAPSEVKKILEENSRNLEQKLT